jgi:hypothetical protein
MNSISERQNADSIYGNEKTAKAVLGRLEITAAQGCFYDPHMQVKALRLLNGSGYIYAALAAPPLRRYA